MITLSDTTTGKSFTTTRTQTVPQAQSNGLKGKKSPSIGGHVATLADNTRALTRLIRERNGGNPG